MIFFLQTIHLQRGKTGKDADARKASYRGARVSAMDRFRRIGKLLMKKGTPFQLADASIPEVRT
jgi:hypothetical protein